MTDIVERLRGLVYQEEWLEEAAAEIERLRAERDLWRARCYGALWLVPDEKTCGELQEAARQAKALLGNGQSTNKEG